MELDRVLNGLGWADRPEVQAVLQRQWVNSQKDMPPAVGFLASGPLTEACGLLALPGGAREALLAAAARVASDPRLRALAWHLHHCAFRAATYPDWGSIGRWPSADAVGSVLNADGRTFYLLILASGVPGMRAIYDARRIPRDVFEESLAQLRDLLADLHAKEGVWGLSGPERLQWHRFALRGELFRLGRLQFQFGTFKYKVRVFRHRTSHEVVALSEAGVRFLPNGQAACPGRSGAAGTWTSQLDCAADAVTGHPIHPAGRALRRRVHLPSAQWRQVLARDDPALYIHFPAGRPLSHDLCGASFSQAMAFFPRHFADRPFGCFCADSWVLNARLQELLPATSNMVRFQKEMYLLPSETRDGQLLNVVFGGPPEEPKSAPRNTALQRALLDELAAGRHDEAKAGACFLLPEDLDWGRQVYLRQEVLRGQLGRNP